MPGETCTTPIRLWKYATYCAASPDFAPYKDRIGFPENLEQDQLISDNLWCSVPPRFTSHARLDAMETRSWFVP